MCLCFFSQNIAVHVQENVLHFRGDVHFMFVQLWEYFKTLLIWDINSILCAAQGRGAKGQNEYEFSLELLLPVKPDVCVYITVNHRNIILFLTYAF